MHKQSKRSKVAPRLTSLLHTGLVAALIGASTAAHALQPLVTDDTGTQGAGGNQLEASFSRTEGAAGNVDSQLPLAFTRGITEALDVFVEKAHVRSEPVAGPSDSGWGSTALGAKWRFFANNDGTSLAFKPVLTLPVGRADEASGFGVGKASLEATLIVTQELSWGALHGNLVAGKTKFRDPLADTDAWQVSVAPVVNLNEQWMLGFDLGAGREEVGTEKTNTRFAEVGAIFVANDDLEFALGVIRHRTTELGGAHEYATEATGGVTWRFR